jgi:hypothetical protein
MASMVAFSESTWPRTVLRPFCFEYSITCFIKSQPIYRAEAANASPDVCSTSRSDQVVSSLLNDVMDHMQTSPRFGGTVVFRPDLRLVV